MCGIDELFSSQSLDEQSEPTERFIQALNEYGAADDFRKLLESHFCTTWGRELGGIEKIETALKIARQSGSLSDKISTFVQSIAGKTSGGWFQYGFTSDELLEMARRSYPARFAFAQAVAVEVFPESPYGFYQCFEDSINIRFETFVLRVAPAYYGEFGHLTLLLVNDKRLAEISESARKELLWAVFEHMVQWDFSFNEHLTRLFTWETYASVPNRETLQFCKAFDYLGAWVGADAKSRTTAASKELLDFILYDLLYDRESRASRLWDNADTSIEEAEKQTFKDWVHNWFHIKRHEMAKTWCCNLELEGLAEADIETWARQSYECYLPLYQELTPEKAALLIDWGINEDLGKLLEPKSKRDSLLDSGSHSRIWYISSFREAWRSHLASSMKALSFEDLLCVLKRHFGSGIRIFDDRFPQYVSLPQENFKQDESGYGWFEFRVDASDCEWWDSLLRALPNDETFPKGLYPVWTMEALSRFGHSEDFTPFADKSLGIVRGDVSNEETQLKEENIGPLLRNLEQFAPEKALRHRLLLLRNSRQPCTSENLDHDRNSLCPLTMSEILKEFSSAHFWHETRRHLRSDDEWNSEELQLLSSFRAWFAKFCLSRLQLRKGEKAAGNGYQPEQVVEQSASWRKAYLKALEELGVDLQGKVHKTAFFVRQSDPAEDVREVAKGCYKAVRREHNKSETATDIRRGLVAAYWWLLLAQRHALGVKINEEEAVRTRRRLLRRP